MGNLHDFQTIKSCEIRKISPSHLESLLIWHSEHVRFELNLVLFVRGEDIELKKLEGGEEGMFLGHICNGLAVGVLYDHHPIIES